MRWPTWNDVDEELLAFLQKESIKATFFINERWIDENKALFLELAENRLFQIENHGSEHLPLSVNGKSAWGIEGTASPEEVRQEVVSNQKVIAALTGRAPTFFRSGTAYYDEIAIEIVEDLGLEVVNFNILGDAGATYSAEQVQQALLTATAGSIALLHMNQPDSGTAEGVQQAVPELKERGFSFVKLNEHELE